jgi:hypothetical protein
VLEPAESLSTVEGVVMGTPRYMSPEQARGEKVDARSDIFSFGAMLYEVLSGRPAFDADSDLGVLDQVRFAEPERLPKTIDSRLRAIVARCLEKEPHHRFQDGGQLAAALGGEGRVKRVAARTVASIVALAILTASTAAYVYWSSTRLSPAWEGVEQLVADWPAPAQVAARNFAAPYFDNDVAGFVPIGRDDAFDIDVPLIAFWRGRIIGDRAMMIDAIARAPDDRKRALELELKILDAVDGTVPELHPFAHGTHGLDAELEAVVGDPTVPWPLRESLASAFDDARTSVRWCRKLSADEPGVFRLKQITARRLARTGRPAEALDTINAAKAAHPRVAKLLLQVEWEALTALGRWRDADVLAREMLKDPAQRMSALSLLRETAVVRNDAAAAELINAELSDNVEGDPMVFSWGPDTWPNYDLHVAYVGQPHRWPDPASVADTPNKKWEEPLYLTRGRLAYLLEDLARLDAVIERLRAGPLGATLLVDKDERQAASLTLFQVFRATLSKTPDDDALAAFEKATISPFARHAALADYYLALGQPEQATPHVAALDPRPLGYAPSAVPQVWLRDLLQAELLEAQGDRDGALDALRAMGLRESQCTTYTNDRARPCVFHAIEAALLQAELETDPARISRALARFTVLWPSPDADLPFVKRADAARERLAKLQAATPSASRSRPTRR